MSPSDDPIRLIISSGEPAGIGPDLCLMAIQRPWIAKLLFLGNAKLFQQRAQDIDVKVQVNTHTQLNFDALPPHQPGQIEVLDLPMHMSCKSGVLDPSNVHYVLNMLNIGIDACNQKIAHALVTAPVHKGVINDAGIAFSGHTELLAQKTGAAHPVMMLCTGSLRVALATTHLPLKDVSVSLNAVRLTKTLKVLHHGLQQHFALSNPRISVCGLNPHAGEGGHLGREEIDLIEPVLAQLRSQHQWILHGPLPADTLFTPKLLEQCDAVLAMYHDQGLPVLKYAGFGSSVNVTLGLPIIRTSVDHGTALDLAASGQCHDGSMIEAIKLALSMASASQSAS